MESIHNIGTVPTQPKGRQQTEEAVDVKKTAAPKPDEEHASVAPADATPAPAPSPEQTVEVVDALREALSESQPSDWSVGIHEDADSGQTIIEIKDAEGEVVKQFPPEIVLNLHRKLDDLAGVVIDETT